MGRGWFGIQAARFQAKTGLTDLEWDIDTQEDFGRVLSYQDDVVTSGAGAAVSPGPFGTVMKLLGPNVTTLGYARWFKSANSTDADSLWSLRQCLWMASYRIAVIGNLASGQAFTIGLAKIVSAAPTFKIGLGCPNAVTDTNWHLTINDVDMFNTGVPMQVGASGNNYFIDLYLGCFDYKNLVVNLLPSAPDQVALQMSALNAYGNDISARPFIGSDTNGGNAVQQGLYVDKAMFMKGL